MKTLLAGPPALEYQPCEAEVYCISNRGYVWFGYSHLLVVGGGGELRVGAFFFVLGRSLARYSIYLSSIVSITSSYLPIYVYLFIYLSIYLPNITNPIIPKYPIPA